MRTAILLLVIALPAVADRIYLKNEGIIEGKATLDGDTYVIQTKSGVVKVPKDNVDHIEQTDDPIVPPKKENKEEGGTFQSTEQGFSFHVKRPGWSFLDSSMRPLASASATNEAAQAEIDVAWLEDKNPASPLTEEAAKSLQGTIRSLCNVDLKEPEELERKPLALPSGPAFQFRTHGRRKLTRTDTAVRCVVLKSGGKLFLLLYEAPFGAPVEIEGAFEDVLSSFKTAGDKPSEEGFYTSPLLEYTLHAPDGWKIAGVDDAEAKTSTVTLDGQLPTEKARLEAREMAVEEDLEKTMATFRDALAKELTAFEAHDERMACIHNLTSRVLLFSFQADDQARAGAALVTREGKRVFLLQTRAAEPAKAGAALDAIAGRLSFMAAKATVKTPKDDLQALTYMSDGDKQFEAGEYHRAESLYTDAVKVKPKFAYAQLMLAQSALCANDLDLALAAAEAGYKLMPKREEFKTTLARARAHRGAGLAKQAQFEKAGEMLAECAALGDLPKNAEEDLHQAFDDLVEASSSQTRAAAQKALKKVHAVIPNDAVLTKDLVKLCVRLAEELSGVGKIDEAEAIVKEAMTYKPNDSGLQDLLKDIESKRKKK